MCRVFVLSLIMFSGIFCSSAQNNTETLQLLDKANKSLYENPDKAFLILQNIDRTKENDIVKQRVQLILASAYDLKGDFAQSVNQSLEKSSDLQNKNSYYVDFALAQQYENLRLYKQSTRLLQSLTKQISKIKSQNYKDNLAAQIYQLNAENFILQKKWKEAENSLEQSNNLLSENENDQIISLENQIYQTFIFLYQKQIEDAEKLINQIELTLNKSPNMVYLRAINCINLGRIYFLKKDYQTSLTTLTKALDLVKNSQYIPLKTRLYNDLSKNYLALKNDELYHKYYSLYKDETDKLDQNKKDALRNLIRLNEQYEAKRIEIANSSFYNNIFIIAIVCLLGIGGIGAFYWNEKQKSRSLKKQIDFFSKLKEINQKTITNSNPIEIKNKKTESENNRKSLNISKEKESEILAKLEEFEKSENFLNRDMSLAVLAGQFDTNTKYLSEIINKYKEKNFNNYINELRINHIALLLKTDSSYLNYKVSYLAEKAGFSSHSSFTTVFKYVTGMSPNTYIQQLTQNKK